jgi:uncharacterized protein
LEAEAKVRLLVDGDAVGFRDFLIAAAIEHQVELVWVGRYDQSAPAERPGLKLDRQVVDTEKEAADLRLMNLSRPGDILVTGDLGLAAVCVNKGCAVLSPRGFWFYEKELAARLEARHVIKRRKAQGLRLKGGPPPSRREDDRRFEEELLSALSAGTGSGDEA